MKRLWIVVLIFAAVIPVHAEMVDITPGGLPDGVETASSSGWQMMQHQSFFDAAMHGIFNVWPGKGAPPIPTFFNDWESNMPNNPRAGGAPVPGGTLFNTNLFQASENAQSAIITWDFSNDSHSMRLILLEALRPTGEAIYHIWAIPWDSRIASTETIHSDEGAAIHWVGFFGLAKNASMPEPATVVLLLSGLVFCWGLKNIYK